MDGRAIRLHRVVVLELGRAQIPAAAPPPSSDVSIESSEVRHSNSSLVFCLREEIYVQRRKTVIQEKGIEDWYPIGSNMSEEGQGVLKQWRPHNCREDSRAPDDLLLGDLGVVDRQAGAVVDEAVAHVNCRRLPRVTGVLPQRTELF